MYVNAKKKWKEKASPPSVQPVSQLRQSRVGFHVGPAASAARSCPKTRCGPMRRRQMEKTTCPLPDHRSSAAAPPTVPPRYLGTLSKPPPHQPLTSVSPPHQAAASPATSWQSHTPGTDCKACHRPRHRSPAPKLAAHSSSAHWSTSMALRRTKPRPSASSTFWNFSTRSGLNSCRGVVVVGGVGQVDSRGVDEGRMGVGGVRASAAGGCWGRDLLGVAHHPLGRRPLPPSPPSFPAPPPYSPLSCPLSSPLSLLHTYLRTPTPTHPTHPPTHRKHAPYPTSCASYPPPLPPPRCACRPGR